MSTEPGKPPVVAGGALSVPVEAIEFAVSRSSGPGGQNVNKVNTRVELRLAVALIAGFTPPIWHRFHMLAGKKISGAGELRIVSQESRSQETNREIVTEMLRELFEEASRLPIKRRATRPSRGSERRRKAGKMHRGDIKQQRRSTGDE